MVAARNRGHRDFPLKIRIGHDDERPFLPAAKPAGHRTESVVLVVGVGGGDPFVGFKKY